MSEHKGRDGTIRKDHYGQGKQPWDYIVENGWAVQFAAGNVLKYLRRNKDPKHSLESARWYYKRLIELCEAEVLTGFTTARHVRYELDLLLTTSELQLLRSE